MCQTDYATSLRSQQEDKIIVPLFSPDIADKIPHLKGVNFFVAVVVPVVVVVVAVAVVIVGVFSLLLLRAFLLLKGVAHKF